MYAAAIALVAAAAVSTPPAPTAHVEDRVAFLSPAARESLDAKLVAYERATGHQVVVWIDNTIGDAALDDWAVRTFAAWKLGRKAHDDGIAIFVLSEDRKIDIEVGYGLEDRVPDAVAARVIREVMTPRLQAGDRDGAVTAGADAVLASIEGRQWQAPAVTTTTTGDTHLRWAVYIILGIISILLMIKYPRAAMWLFWSIASSGIGGSNNRRGGFRGGGGRSGGGGARGGW